MSIDEKKTLTNVVDKMKKDGFRAMSITPHLSITKEEALLTHFE